METVAKINGAVFVPEITKHLNRKEVYKKMKKYFIERGCLAELLSLKSEGLIKLKRGEVLRIMEVLLKDGYPAEVSRLIRSDNNIAAARWFIKWFLKNFHNYRKITSLKEQILAVMLHFRKSIGLYLLSEKVTRLWLNEGYIDFASKVRPLKQKEILKSLKVSCERSMIFQASRAVSMLGWEYFPEEYAVKLVNSFFQRSDLSQRQYIFAFMSENVCRDIPWYLRQKLYDLSIKFQNNPCAMELKLILLKETLNEEDYLLAEEYVQKLGFEWKTIN